RALWVAGTAMSYLDNSPKAIDRCEQSLALARSAADKSTTAYALGVLGWIVLSCDDYRRGRDLEAESLALMRDINDRRGIHLARRCLGLAETLAGNFEHGAQLLSEALSEAYALDERIDFAWTLYHCTNLTWYQRGDADHAAQQYEECLSVFEK